MSVCSYVCYYNYYNYYHYHHYYHYYHYYQYYHCHHCNILLSTMYVFMCIYNIHSILVYTYTYYNIILYIVYNIYIYRSYNVTCHIKTYSSRVPGPVSADHPWEAHVPHEEESPGCVWKGKPHGGSHDIIVFYDENQNLIERTSLYIVIYFLEDGFKSCFMR
jgi:hypothetical protein